MMTLTLISSAFPHYDDIPAKYTCEGPDVSPPLEWRNVVEGTRSFVLIVDDPDAPDPAAPQRTYVHWVLYNIPGGTRELPEGATAATLPKGTIVGTNDWGRAEYGGPCPPIGRHRYYFKLYALRDVLPDMGAATKQQVEEAMEGLIVSRCELVGTYIKEENAKQ